MEFKNVFTMKQPDLGKKISELRKQKGFTQEELVEKCNINVRTIQRIEAGDVTPRSFTVRTILEALGIDAGSFFEENIHMKDTFREEDIRSMRKSWIAAIFFTLFTAITIFSELFLLDNYVNSFEGIAFRTVFGALSLFSLFFFLKGYKILGEQSKNTTLIYATYIYFSIVFLMISITIILTIYDFDYSVVEVTSGILLILLLGVGELILGLGIMKLKDHYGGFAQMLGVVKIVYGTLLITVIFSPIAILLAVPVLVLEIVFLYQTTQKILK